MVSILAKRLPSTAAPIGPRADYREGSNNPRDTIRASIGIIAAAAVLVACSGGNEDPAQGGNQPTVPLTPKGWNLVWSDEFDGSALDSSNWNIQTGDGTAEGIPGWGNNELQSYQAANVTVADGNLIITARQEQADGREYTSGRINTDGKLDIQYGRIEASIHAAAGQGMWSAFWMLPTDSAYGTWAAGGEIDIMEVFSRDPSPFNQAAIHYGMAWPLNTFKYEKYMDVDPADGFHVYALEWDAQEVRWFVDGAHFYTVRNSTYWNYYVDAATNAHVEGSDSAPFDQPFHLLLNLAVGGNLPGAPTPTRCPRNCASTTCASTSAQSTPKPARVATASRTTPTRRSFHLLGDSVYRAAYDLYVDAVGPLTFPDTEDVVALDFGVYDAGGALALSEVEAGDRGMVIDVNTSGGGNFSIFPSSLARQTLFGMGSASDPGDYAGEVQFDLYIFGDETDPASSLQVKLDSGFPDLGFVDLPVETLTKDAWTTITVQISDIAHNPGNFGGGPVDLAQVLSLFVLEPTSHAHVRVDNIRIICGHVGQGDCGIMPPAPPPPAAGEPQPVYIDAVDPIWDVGIAAADSGTNWANYSDGANPANKVQWSEIAAGDRGQILEVSFSDSEAFGVWFIQASMGVDLGAYAPGSVSFDIKVDDYGDNEAGMTMKIDCIFPCTSGDQRIGKVGDGDWETVEIPVAQLLGGGLNLATVNTGIVAFPTEQTSALTFQLDNVQWLPGEGPDGGAAGAVELYGDSVADGWFLWDCCGGATFGEVDDDADHGRVVELAFGATGTVTGFQATEGIDVSALASGTLEFDFKEVSPPPEGSVWRLKLESSNAATAVEVVLTDGGNPEPGPDWQHYRFTLSGDLAGLDLSSVKLVMIFPDWANADGAVGRIDNVRFVPEVASIELYGDALAEGWFLWDCCAGATFGEVQDDEDHGSVIELSFGAGATVTGIQATAGLDASAAAGGTLEFDFKEVSPPPDGSQWRLKLESSGAATAAEVVLTAAGNPMPGPDWQHYSFGLGVELAGIDISDLKLVMFFPDWGNADGAVARIDNIRLVQAP